MLMNNLDVVGVDTNILVYSVNQTSVFHEKASEFLKKARSDHIQAVITWQNVSEFYAVVTDSKRFPKPMAAKNFVAYIETMINTELVRLVLPNKDTGGVFLDLIRKIKPVGQKVHDLFLAATFMSNGVETLVTENGKDFEGIGGIKAMSLSQVE